MIEEKRIINNLEINYKIIGEGRPLLILHGWGRGSDSWVEVQRLLSIQRYKVICPDLPGFGKSQSPTIAWKVDDYVEWLKNFAISLEIEKFVLLGHSFGGRIAIKFAVRYSEKIATLILYEAAGIKSKKTISQFVFFLISKIGNIFSFLPFYSFFRKVFYRFIVRKKDYLKAKGVMKNTFLKVIEEDLTSYLAKISVSTLIIWGEKDKITPLNDAYLMKREIPNSELKIIPEMGHAFHHEAPKRLTQVIYQYLK